MKVFRKWLKAGVSLLICVSLLSVSVLAAGPETDDSDREKTGVTPGTVVKSDDCGFNTGTLFYEVIALGNDEYKLRIYGTGKMLTIGATYGAPWHDYAESIVSIELEEGLESIAQFAFTDCDHVTSITIPASVTTMYTKSMQMRGLKSVYFLGSYGEKMKADAFDRTEDLKVYYDQSDPSWSGKSFNNATMQADEISLENVVAVEASCTTDGNIQYYYNRTWDKFFSDAEGKLEITDKDSVVIQALGHDWDAGVVTKEPTDTEEGVKTYTCSRCKETREEGIPVPEAGGVPGDVTVDENIQDGENPDIDDDADGIIAGGETTETTGITEITGTAGENQPVSIQNDKSQAVKTTAGQVKTADENPYVLYIVLLLLSSIAIAWAVRRRFFS